ncbi:hypothetical protein ASPZODRAFT_74146 [Penicilliopsis zonata CBS 506.65]|uniref:Major facilitator superfamily (MFS) profile domain-containing protein n=1 Tax=Penicilliopsis zonata CBS 506.65 TaxID=1073090 RepID=A0A1L9S8M8_9EURO|nr:hypothetical protein ASPZODRAFT_74146 [Penicilliopsis zonata CBS 506.65]OJJ43509.1 hypothetical protein ASPZODRAFT_74146 [Penicilliopsis zonata CBS 506.65]
MAETNANQPLETQDGAEMSASSDDGEPKHEYPSGLAVAFILISVTLAYFLFFLDLAVISTASPSITSQFNSLVDVGWYGGGYQLGSAALQPLSGKIYSRFSIKWTFFVFFLIFEVGSAICGAAQSSAMFIAGRVIAGMGSAGVANGAVTTISAILPVQKQALFMGLNMGMGQLGLATGPIIGGAFTTNVSWRWCFYINLPLGAAVGAFLLFNTIPEPKPKDPPLQILRSVIKELDLIGFLLVCPAVVMFLLGLQFGGNEYAWDSPVVIGLIIGGAATFAVFLVWEWRQGDDAMVPLAMLKHRVIWSAAATMFFSLSSVLVADFYIAIYFQSIGDDTPLMSGVHMLPITLGIVLFTMVSGTLISVLGYYLPFLLAGGAISSIGYGLLSKLSPTTPTATWIGYQVLYGVGSGCTTAAPYIAIQSLVAPEQISLAMGIIIFWQNIGGATSLIAANAIFDNSLRSELEKRAAEISLSPDTIINAGVRSIRSLVSGSELTAVLAAYAKSVDKVMYLGIAVSLTVIVVSPGLGWRDIRKVKAQELQVLSSKSPNRVEKILQ